MYVHLTSIKLITVQVLGSEIKIRHVLKVACLKDVFYLEQSNC